MLKPTLLIISLLVGTLAVAVYQVERRVEMLQAELKTLNNDIEEDRRAMHVLDAEWSYLNRPDRLERMAIRYFQVDRLTPAKFSEVDLIPMRDQQLMPVDHESDTTSGRKQVEISQR